MTPAGALAGIRVLDLTRLLPGDYCSMLLSDLGADVIKVEDVGPGDYLRWAAPFHAGVERSASSAIFVALNRGKRSVRLDLKEDDGRRAFRALAHGADVLIESFRPGVMKRLELDYESLRPENPHLIYCSISGYGQSGTHRLRAGHDLNYVGLTGLLAMSGEADGPPIQSPTQVADIGGGGQLAALGILAAIVGRQKTGVGQFVDISMTHGAAAWLGMAAAAHLCDGSEQRRGNIPLGGGMVCYRPYRCSDGWVTLGAVEEKFWVTFCEGVGRPDLLKGHHDPPGSETHSALEKIFAGRSRSEWQTFALEHDCCLEPVVTLDEALASPLLSERGMVVEIDQPGAVRPVRVLGCPIALDGRQAATTLRAAPGLGEHTVEVLSEAGVPDVHIQAMLGGRSAAGVDAASGYSFRV